MADKEGMLLILFILYAVFAAVQYFYYIWFYLPVIRKKEILSAESDQKPPVSVIVCARNEADNLEKFMPALLTQDYPSFEVIVVNDCSEDRSDEVLGDLLEKYPNLKVSSITRDPRFTHNKKFAQFIGIKAASNDILLFTDADCTPVSGRWIASMISGFGDKTEIVLGYGGYLRRKGLLNLYIRYDTFFIAVQYLGMAIRGIPYMGVGRNLAYRRDLFFRSRGFGKHNHLISGDDDLFVNSNATGENTECVLRPESHTRSVPAENTGMWVKQKQRHLTTAVYYRLNHKILLSLEPFSRIMFYALLIILLAKAFIWQAVISLFAARLILQWVVLGLASKKLNESGIIPVSFIFDIFSPVINLSLYLGSIRNRSGKMAWK